MKDKKLNTREAKTALFAGFVLLLLFSCRLVYVSYLQWFIQPIIDYYAQ